MVKISHKTATQRLRRAMAKEGRKLVITRRETATGVVCLDVDPVNNSAVSEERLEDLLEEYKVMKPYEELE